MDNNRHGLGTFYYENGDEYSGTWKNHKKDGEGIYRFKKTGREEKLIYEEGNLVKKVSNFPLIFKDAIKEEDENG